MVRHQLILRFLGNAIYSEDKSFFLSFYFTLVDLHPSTRWQTNLTGRRFLWWQLTIWLMLTLSFWITLVLTRYKNLHLAINVRYPTVVFRHLYHSIKLWNCCFLSWLWDTLSSTNRCGKWLWVKLLRRFPKLLQHWTVNNLAHEVSLSHNKKSD